MVSVSRPVAAEKLEPWICEVAGVGGGAGLGSCPGKGSGGEGGKRVGEGLGAPLDVEGLAGGRVVVGDEGPGAVGIEEGDGDDGGGVAGVDALGAGEGVFAVVAEGVELDGLGDGAGGAVDGDDGGAGRAAAEAGVELGEVGAEGLVEGEAPLDEGLGGVAQDLGDLQEVGGELVGLPGAAGVFGLPGAEGGELVLDESAARRVRLP